MSEYIKKINEFIALFLCMASAAIIIFAEFITEKFGISEYIIRDKKGIVDRTIEDIVIRMSLIMFIALVSIFVAYLKIRNDIK